MTSRPTIRHADEFTIKNKQCIYDKFILFRKPKLNTSKNVSSHYIRNKTKAFDRNKTNNGKNVVPTMIIINKTELCLNVTCSSENKEVK